MSRSSATPGYDLQHRAVRRHMPAARGIGSARHWQREISVATVTTCADMSDIVAQIVTPGRPERELGNLTPNVQACLGWDGLWVYADSCT